RQHLLGDAVRLDRGREAAIDRDLPQHGAEFLLRQAAIMPMFSRLRSRGLRSSSLHTAPQANSLSRSWNLRSKSVVLPTARSTYSSPSTRRRVAIPLS